MEIAIRVLEDRRADLLRRVGAKADEMNWRDPEEKQLLVIFSLKVSEEVKKIDEAILMLSAARGSPPAAARKVLGSVVDGLAGGNPKLPASRDSSEEDSATSQERWSAVFENHSLLGGR